MFWWWWSLAAQAACEVSQTPSDQGVVVQVTVMGRPEGCRLLHLYASDEMSLSGAWYSPAQTRWKLPKDHLALLPGGVWEVIAPELEDQGRLVLDVRFPSGLSEQPTLTIALANQKPEAATAVERLDQLWSFSVNPRHPGWSFADPSQGSTSVEATWHLLPGAAPEVLPLPTKAKILSLEGGSSFPGALRSSGDVVKVRYTLPGTPAQGDMTLPPGSFTLQAHGLEMLTAALPPEGGRVAWRVTHMLGASVIPDLATFVAGLNERFRVRSLPEPAVPMALRGMEDREALYRNLYREVRDLPTIKLPGQEPLQPGQLNRVWQRGWGSAVEKGLILHRLLGQERYERRWVLTGENADPTYYTGYDAILLRTSEGWLDPACGACAPGEVSARWLGRPMIDEAGEQGEIPRLPGKLQRTITLQDSTFAIDIQAEGEAAVWIREAIVDLDPPQQQGRLLRLLGVPEGQIVGGEGLDRRGHPLSIRLTSPRPPNNPWPDGEPWG